VSKRAAVASRQTADVVELNITPLLDFQSEYECPMQVKVTNLSKDKKETFKVIPATRDELISLSLLLGTCHSFPEPVKHEIVPGQSVMATRISDEVINLKFTTDADFHELLFDPEIKKSLSVNVSINSAFAFEDLINQVLNRDVMINEDFHIDQQLASVA
jgi:hypothetical protein